MHHRSLFEQSEIFKFAFFCVLQQHNLGFSVLGTYHLAKWGQNRLEVQFGYDFKKFTVFSIKKMRLYLIAVLVQASHLMANHPGK